MRFGIAAVETWKQEGLEKALAVTEKISNDELKEIVISAIRYKNGSSALTKEGPDKALEQARAIKLPMFRVWLFRTVAYALRTAGRSEQSEAIQEELLMWLESSEKSPRIVAGLFAYLDNTDNVNTEQKFTALNTLGIVLNKVSLEPSPNLFPQEIYWHPLFHNYEKSVSALVRADFERTLETARNIFDKEARLTMQTAVCAEYLRQTPGNKNTDQTPRKADTARQ